MTAAPVNEGLRQLVLSKIVFGNGYQSRLVGRPLPADRAAVLIARLVGWNPQHAVNVMRLAEQKDDAFDEQAVPTPVTVQVAGGGYLKAVRPEFALVS